MMKRTRIMLGLGMLNVVLLAAILGATAANPPEPEPDTSCEDGRIAALRAATNVNESKQEQYLMAAEAYKQLMESGATC